jgi:hypothetical protein
MLISRNNSNFLFSPVVFPFSPTETGGAARSEACWWAPPIQCGIATQRPVFCPEPAKLRSRQGWNLTLMRTSGHGSGHRSGSGTDQDELWLKNRPLDNKILLCYGYILNGEASESVIKGPKNYKIPQIHWGKGPFKLKIVKKPKMYALNSFLVSSMQQKNHGRLEKMSFEDGCDSGQLSQWLFRVYCWSGASMRPKLAAATSDN